jgi:hypothetical protein
MLIFASRNLKINIEIKMLFFAVLDTLNGLYKNHSVLVVLILLNIKIKSQILSLLNRLNSK